MSYDVDDKMLERFAERAKKLMYGMRKRLHRDPDVADFFFAFQDELGVGDPRDPEDGTLLRQR
jgi:hypothetical protein